jgi:integrase
MATRITDRLVEQVKPAAARREIGDAIVPSLYLIVQPSGARSFAVRYRHAGKTIKHTLGAYPKLGLADARELARSALRAVAEGRDPVTEQKEKRRQGEAGISDRDLFERVYNNYLARHVRPNLKPRSAEELQGIFRREVLSRWRRRRLAEITKADVRELLDEVVDSGKPLVASQVFTAVRAFFNWCVGRDLIAASPCAGLKKPGGSESRGRKLSDQEVGWLWQACDEIGHPFGPIIKLLLLTGCRKEEVRAMTERELDLAGRVWTIPGARTKNALEHQVALANATIAVIESVPRVSNPARYVFSVTGKTPPSGFSRAKHNIDELMLTSARELARKRGEDPDQVAIEEWVIHDLRRTMASGMARLGVSLPVAEKCLNHISGSFSGIAAVYQRHEYVAEKRDAFERWARHVETITAADSANVIPLRASA